MKRRVLVVHPDANLFAAVVDLLTDVGEELGCDFAFRPARTLAGAMEQIGKGTIDLLVTALAIAADDASPIAAGEQGRLGMELASRLWARAPGARVIVVVGTAEAGGEVAAREGLEVVDEGQHFGAQLGAAVRRLLGHLSSAPRSQQVELSITLSTAKGCGCQFQREGERPGQWMPLTMDGGRLKDLVEQSRDVNIGSPSWERDLKRLGEAFADELFQLTPNNIAFRDAFHEWMGRVGIDNIRVRFTVEDDLHPIAVEALKQRNADYWMLKTAVYRGQERRGDGPSLEPRGLFQDEQTRSGPVNVLIIQADMPANAVVRIGSTSLAPQRLPRLAAEVEAITTLLAGLKAQGQPIGEVKVVRPAEAADGGSFMQRVEDSVKGGGWHIVHYAGHTHYDTAERAGYLLFPGSGARSVEAVRIDVFAWLLRKADTRFVFLSSCESAGQDFIYHLARERIPAIMGFLWKVNDERAVDFARSFYGHLLADGRSTLEHACFEAKKEMHAKFCGDPIWASPVLVMQVSP